MVNFSNVFGILRTLVVGGVLLILNNFAHADIWGYVDERGTAHFAAEQVDKRYSLFFRGEGEFDSRRDVSIQPALSSAVPASAAQANAAARLLSLFDVSPTYKKLGIHLQEASRTHGVDYALLQAQPSARWWACCHGPRHRRWALRQGYRAAPCVRAKAIFGRQWQAQLAAARRRAASRF